MRTILFITDLHIGAQIKKFAGVFAQARARGWHVVEIEHERERRAPFQNSGRLGTRLARSSTAAVWKSRRPTTCPVTPSCSSTRTRRRFPARATPSSATCANSPPLRSASSSDLGPDAAAWAGRDPDGDALSWKWVLLSDTDNYDVVGASLPMPPGWDEAIVAGQGTTKATVRLPGGGNYRLYAYCFDGKGAAAYANVPVAGRLQRRFRRCPEQEVGRGRG